MRCTKAFTPLVTGLTMVALSTEALAAPDDDVKETPLRHRNSEILVRMDEPRVETRSWLEQHVSVSKGQGIAYHYRVPTQGDDKVIVGVGGPVLKRNRFGLMFELNF